VALAAAGVPGLALGTHGGPIDGVVVDFVGLQPSEDGTASPACAAGGLVHNASSRVVTVRVYYRGVDAAGRMATAFARIVRVAPGESRPFASTHFVGDGGQEFGCVTLRKVEMVDAVADPDLDP